MDDALRVVCEMNECILSGLKPMVADLANDEIAWRPLPESNTINIIVRHLRIEAQWHLDSLKSGAKMPLSDVTPALQKEIDAVPLDFHRNFEKLEELYTAFLAILRTARCPAWRSARRPPTAAAPRLLGGRICLDFTKRCMLRRTAARFARFETSTGRLAESRHGSFLRTPRTRDSRARCVVDPVVCKSLRYSPSVSSVSRWLLIRRQVCRMEEKPLYCKHLPGRLP